MDTPSAMLVFGGQEMMSLNDYQRVISLATSPSGTVLLDACHTAFHEELLSLSPEELKNADICASDFAKKDSILVPDLQRYRDNPTISGASLLLLQSLAYLAYAEAACKNGTHASFTHCLKSWTNERVGILGFSSGIISACVVATSPSIPSFISNALQAYRLALWIGIRSQLHRKGILDSYILDLPGEARSWSLMLRGLDKTHAQQFITCFNQPFGAEPITITAVMSNGCVTVSGEPNYLDAFAATLPDEAVVYQTKINALYHRQDLRIVRTAVLADVASRNIRFPLSSDLFAPIRSTFTGDLICANIEPYTLVEQVVDMILIHPVNWDVVVEKTASNMPSDMCIKLLNIGLSSTLIKLLERAISRAKASCQVVDFAEGVKAPRPKVKQEPIAIIGMAIKMPGASTVADLWKVLESGTNTVAAIPDDRFSLHDYKDRNTPGRSMKATTGNFVDDIGQFDNKFFNISPREARSMDPQQRVLLQVGYEALEDAGYVPYSTPTFSPDTIGCFIGAATHDYIHNLRQNIDVYYSTGTLAAFLSGRLSYCLGLSGPSMVVDTACSSSLVAIHQAVRALMNKDCHAALAGGVNVISSPDMYIGLDKGHFLTASGQCKSFDAMADGYSRSEGCGIFVLKRLADAEAENDRILGVIRGVEVNQSGNAHSITHPHIATQESLFRQLLSCSDVDSNSVSLVEAHGTGTQAGDTCEMESIRRVLAVDRMPNNPLYVTSIKANIGHLEAASGCASLAKVLLMLQHNTIPQQISLQHLNPGIAPLGASRIVICKENVGWPSGSQRDHRISVVNNFGAAGSNAALLVEEYIQKDLCLSSMDRTPHVFGFSAKDEATLKALRSQFVEWLQASINHDVSLKDIAYSTTARRQLYRYRSAVVAVTKDELAKKLATSPIFDAPESPPVIFVFSGQGSHYHGMGRSLYLSSLLFKRHIDECDFLLTSFGFTGILSMITGDGDEFLPDPEVQQTAIFSLEYALAKLWMSWNIQPIAVVGHSLGEYAALVIAGILTLKDTLYVVATRARLMVKKCAQKSTGMAAVYMDACKLQSFLDENQYTDLSISCFNSPQDCVVSGPLSSLQGFIRHIERETKSKATQLSVPYAYHSSSMDPLTDDLINITGKLRPSPTQIPFISTVLNQIVMPGDQLFPPTDYLAQHCSGPVRLTDAIQLYSASPLSARPAIWLEIGPHPTVLPMLKSFPSMSTAVLVETLSKGQDSWISLSKALTSIYVKACPIDWRSVFSGTGSPACVSLPSYPFTLQNFWVPFPEESALQFSPSPKTQFSFIECCSQLPRSNGDTSAVFETSANHLSRYIEGHRVGGVPLCPASVHLELVYASVRLTCESLLRFSAGDTVVLREVGFPKPLACTSASGHSDINLSVAIDVSTKSFTVKSVTCDTAVEVLHAKGFYDVVAIGQMAQDLTLSFPSVLSSITGILKPENKTPETFSTRTTYQIIFPRVVEYSKEFQTLQSLTILSDGMEAVGTLALGPDCETGNFVVHPLFLDTFLHVAGFLSNMHGGSNDAYICNEIGSIRLLPSYFEDTTATFTIYCKITSLPDQRCMVGETYVISTGSTGRLVAHIEGIRFQRVRLSGLKACLATILPADNPLEHLLTNSANDLPSKDVVHRLVAKTCEMNLDDVALDSGFDQLGIDSLMRHELSYELSKAFPRCDYRAQELSGCNNINELTNMIMAKTTLDSLGQPGPGVFPQTPPSLAPGSPSPSVTLVHYAEASTPVKRIFANILDMDEGAIEDDSELLSLGLDSLASIEALHTLRQEYNMDVPEDLIHNARTIRDVEDQMTELKPSYFPFMSPQKPIVLQIPFTKMCNALSASKPLTLLQNSSSDLAPLVLIHDGSGLTVSYERLLKLDRRVWAISNPHFHSAKPWPSVVEMAQAYANLIFDEIEGPIILGGWSFGGVVAFDIARQLQARSVKIKGVILIDSPDPLSHVPLSRSLIDRVLGGAENLDLASRNLCKIQFTMNAQLLGDYSALESSKYDCAPLVFLRSTDPYTAPNPEDSPSWLSNRSDPNHITRGWNIISNGRLIKSLDIPGNHFEPFGAQNIGIVSNRISEACGLLDMHKLSN